MEGHGVRGVEEVLVFLLLLPQVYIYLRIVPAGYARYRSRRWIDFRAGSACAYRFCIINCTGLANVVPDASHHATKLWVETPREALPALQISRDLLSNWLLSINDEQDRDIQINIHLQESRRQFGHQV